MRPRSAAPLGNMPPGAGGGRNRFAAPPSEPPRPFLVTCAGGCGAQGSLGPVQMGFVRRNPPPRRPHSTRPQNSDPVAGVFFYCPGAPPAAEFPPAAYLPHHPPSEFAPEFEAAVVCAPHSAKPGIWYEPLKSHDGVGPQAAFFGLSEQTPTGHCCPRGPPCGITRR